MSHLLKVVQIAGFTTDGQLNFMSNLFSRVHATLQVTLSVCRSVGLSVGRSVGWSVCRSHFAFFAFLGYLQVGKHIFEYLVS